MKTGVLANLWTSSYPQSFVYVLIHAVPKEPSEPLHHVLCTRLLVNLIPDIPWDCFRYPMIASAVFHIHDHICCISFRKSRSGMNPSWLAGRWWWLRDWFQGSQSPHFLQPSDWHRRYISLNLRLSQGFSPDLDFWTISSISGNPCDICYFMEFRFFVSHGF